MHSELRTVADRTRAVADVVKSLGEELIPGIRNEVLVSLTIALWSDSSRIVCKFFLSRITIYSIVFEQLYPVTSSHGGPVFFSLERAAAPYFGIKV